MTNNDWTPDQPLISIRDVHKSFGEQEVNDPDLDKLALRRKVGMVFQQYNLFPHKTALENIMMAPIKVLRSRQKKSKHGHINSLNVSTSAARKIHTRANYPVASSNALPSLDPWL